MEGITDQVEKHFWDEKRRKCFLAACILFLVFPTLFLSPNHFRQHVTPACRMGQCPSFTLKNYLVPLFSLLSTANYDESYCSYQTFPWTLKRFIPFWKEFQINLRSTLGTVITRAKMFPSSILFCPQRHYFLSPGSHFRGPWVFFSARPLFEKGQCPSFTSRRYSLFNTKTHKRLTMNAFLISTRQNDVRIFGIRTLPLTTRQTDKQI